MGFFIFLKPLFYTNRKVVLGGDFNVSVDKEPKGDLAHLLRSFFVILLKWQGGLYLEK